MEDVTIDEIMEDGGGDHDLVELKRGVAKKKGRGFDDNDAQKDSARGYDTLDDDGSSGPQRSVEGWIIFVTNVHEEAQEDEVKEAFKDFGNVINMHLNLDRRTGYFKGYAIVQYETQQEAAEAIAALNGLDFLGQKLTADWCFVKGSRANLMSFYGTAFEELSDEEHDAVKKKPKATQDEVVTDEKGRRRFHGAFTGGFSAGYFNTAGSKHGWAPQTFKSSRERRAEKSTFGVEDFMDDEDFGEFGIASKRICTKSDFVDSLVATAGEKSQLAWERTIFPQNSVSKSFESSITSSLMDILKPVNDSIGLRLLKKMGWRAGKGAGPSMSRRALERQKVIDALNRGETREFDESAVREIESVVPDAEFCSEDTQEFEFVAKENCHGLGYVPLRNTGVLEQTYGSVASGLKLSRRGKAIRGQAFGVGAFEDDDEDVYTNYDLSQYDFEVGASTSTLANRESARFDQTFVPAKKPLSNARKFFDPPKLAAGYRPILKLPQMNVENLSEKVLKSGEKLTPFERARFLGDRTNSVMELLSDRDRRFLKEVRANSDRQANTSNAKQVTPKAVAAEPFEEEPMKLHRFKQFVHYLKIGVDYPQPVGLTRLEWEKELSQFESALTPELRALLPEVCARQKPLAKVEFAQPIAEQLKSRFEKESGFDDSYGSKEKTIKDHDRIQAVRMKMFGEMTRHKYQWFPSNELCKRFNVPNPNIGSAIVGVPELQKRSNKTIADAMEFTVLGSNSALGLPNTANELVYNREIVEKTKAVEENDFSNWDNAELPIPQTNKQLNNNGISQDSSNQAPWELLQALFQESSSENDSDSDSEIKVVNADFSISGQENTENLKTETNTDDQVIVEKMITVFDLVEDDDVYGPKLPPENLEKEVYEVTSDLHSDDIKRGALFMPEHHHTFNRPLVKEKGTLQKSKTVEVSKQKKMEDKSFKKHKKESKHRKKDKKLKKHKKKSKKKKRSRESRSSDSTSSGIEFIE